MLVIFDCDGVLVDSETLAADVFSQCLARQGVRMSAAACYSEFHGHTLPYCFTWIESHFDVSLPENFTEILSTATRERFTLDLLPVAGVEKLLRRLLRRNIPFCVASNGEHKKINHSLAVTGLDKFFPESDKKISRFSREDVLQGKPAPDLFLHAAEVSGVAPQSCWVIEDSPSGYKAAVSAGMQLVQYVPQADLPGGPRGGNICRNMDEVAVHVID
ncbi:HAD family hydrolase [Teredinibacter franksiae]|uniref:HAD family hydrolase n=1 Tax=Teredinibacter franksiae TaxID=2761453 RepID=UPI001627970B|nr:HAD family phosphatase [Teredinibacter franksiae]